MKPKNIENAAKELERKKARPPASRSQVTRKIVPEGHIQAPRHDTPKGRPSRQKAP